MNRIKAYLPLILLAGISCSQPTAKTPQPHEMIEGNATYVIDGNTFYFTSDYGKVKARVYNIDTPAIEAKNGFQNYEFLRGLIHQKSMVVEYIATDDDGRWLVDANLTTGENVRDKILERFPPPKIIRKPNPQPKH